MKKYFFAFNVLFFFAFLASSEATPEVRQEIVEFLKLKLNSDRIEYFFGNYGVDTLEIDSQVFPESRIANLYSVHQDKKIMRTLAVVDFFLPVQDDLYSVHAKIMKGKSIGIAFREDGWMIHKKPVYFGVISLSPELMDWMDECYDSRAAVHIYQLAVSKNERSGSIPYCTIVEVHSPQYLSEDWLQALYDDQYAEFSLISLDVKELLSRLSVLIREFPPVLNKT